MSDPPKSLLLLLLLTLAAAAHVIHGTEGVTTPLATHFSVGGAPDGGVMSPSGYRWFAAGLWLLLVASFWTARPIVLWVGPRWLNLPHRDAWIGQPRERTAAIVGAWLEGMGLLTLMFVMGVHESVFQANEVSPPQLNQPVFLAMLGGYFAVLLALMVRFFRRMRRPPA